MRIVTWNVNSLPVRLSQVLEWLELHRPDVLALQETKVEDALFPRAQLEAAGYHAVFSGQRTYNGVAILSRHEPQDVQAGIPGFEDEQRRVIAATVNGVRVVNLYVPNGESLHSPKFDYKQRWLEALARYADGAVALYGPMAFYGLRPWEEWASEWAYRLFLRLMAALDKPNLAGANMAFRREVALEAGGYPPVYAREDVLLGLALQERGRVRYVPEAMVRTSARRLEKGLLPFLAQQLRNLSGRTEGYFAEDGGRGR
ncbi:MAG: hypothetical protein C4333_03120 [Meiothermus sp.]